MPRLPLLVLLLGVTGPLAAQTATGTAQNTGAVCNPMNSARGCVVGQGSPDGHGAARELRGPDLLVLAGRAESQRRLGTGHPASGSVHVRRRRGQAGRLLPAHGPARAGRRRRRQRVRAQRRRPRGVPDRPAVRRGDPALLLRLLHDRRGAWRAPPRHRAWRVPHGRPAGVGRALDHRGLRGRSVLDRHFAVDRKGARARLVLERPRDGSAHGPADALLRGGGEARPGDRQERRRRVHAGLRREHPDQRRVGRAGHHPHRHALHRRISELDDHW